MQSQKPSSPRLSPPCSLQPSLPPSDSADREAALEPWRVAAELASDEAQRAERRCRAVDRENRLVARGLEREWEEPLKALDAKADLARRESERRRMITEQERSRLLAIGPDLASLWNPSTTMARDGKELLRTLIDEVVVKVERQALCAHLTVRWKGCALTEIDLDLPRSRPAPTAKGLRPANQYSGV
jgi:hypothetical protein